MQPGVETITFNGQECLRLTSRDGSSAVVCRHGAHVLSWIDAQMVEQSRKHFSLCRRSNLSRVACLGIAHPQGIWCDAETMRMQALERSAPLISV